MSSKFNNIRTILFLTYSLIIVVVFTVLVLWFYSWSSGELRRNAMETLAGMGSAVQAQIDSELQKMNDVSLNVMYSNLVKDQFRQLLEAEPPAGGQSAEGAVPGQSSAQPPPGTEAAESAKQLAEILTAAIGPSRPVEQLYLYDFEGTVYGNGFDNGERAYDPKSKPWYDAVVAQPSTRHITLPAIDTEMAKYVSTRRGLYSLSLLRVFFDNYNVPIGIVEVKQYYNRIFRSLLDERKLGAYREQVVVYDREGRIVFPIDESAGKYDAYIRLTTDRSEAASGASTAVRNPETGEDELLSTHRSELTGWTTVLIVSERELLADLSVFTRKTVPVALAILLLAIALSFFAARRIAFPIQKIHRAVRNYRLEDAGTKRFGSRDLNSGLNELDQLYWEFQRMSSRLKESMDELLLAQSQELQSKLVALQSQMNPHFLYNTLATIQGLAEENRTEQIVALSENMSGFLRYISSDASLVPMDTELSHTRSYLEINQLRFGRKLSYAFDIDERIGQCPIPKLVIQPLVENAIKFVTRSEPNWTIRVEGRLEEGRWSIEVSDDGAGFSEESLRTFADKRLEIERTGIIPALQLNGMGLLNIYIRLRLTYGNQAMFHAENRPEGGASVTIGGMLATGD